MKSALNDLREQVDTLLKSSKGIDEHKAKLLRKSWDDLRIANHDDKDAKEHEQNSKGDADNETEQTTEANALEAQFEKLRVAIHEQVEKRNAQYATLESDLEKLKKELDAGELKDAQQHEQKIINGLNKIKGLSSQKRQAIITEIEKLRPKIQKLSSWRHWGTEQARQKIITEITELHENESNLEKTAKFIQQARDQWKTWDQSGEGGDKKLYKEFDEACTKAYEPCKKLFEAQRKQREASSKHRFKVCEVLEAEYEKIDWHQPDWKGIQKSLREQGARWKKLGPADFKDRKSLNKRFTAINDQYERYLDRERKINIKQREILIAEIVALAELGDTRKAISEVLQLKKKWLVTVSSGRKVEQAIWKQFTGACDAIFEKGREAKKEFESELNAQLVLKQKLCDEIETAVDDTENTTADELGIKIKQWKTGWKELGKTPKNQTQKIEKRFRDAIAKANKQFKALEQKQQHQVFEKLMIKADLCSELEQAVITNTDMNADIAARWEALEPLNQELEKSIGLRYAMANKANQDDAAAKKLKSSLDKNFDQINDYLVQLEISCDVDSPAQYAKLRMALQVSRLSAAMGKATTAQLDSAALINRIYCTGAVAGEHQQTIKQRTKACYQALYSA